MRINEIYSEVKWGFMYIKMEHFALEISGTSRYRCWGMEVTGIVVGVVFGSRHFCSLGDFTILMVINRNSIRICGKRVRGLRR